MKKVDVDSGRFGRANKACCRDKLRGWQSESGTSRKLQ